MYKRHHLVLHVIAEQRGSVASSNYSESQQHRNTADVGFKIGVEARQEEEEQAVMNMFRREGSSKRVNLQVLPVCIFFASTQE